MSNESNAILRGIQAAARMHRDFDLRPRIEEGGGKVDVFDVIATLDVPLLFKPLDALLGAFLPNPSPGILITTKRPLSVQRFTGAHELGHYALRHEPSLDKEDILTRSPFTSTSSYGLQEMEADAFAVEFLLPKWLILTQLKKHGWQAEDMSHPEAAYQLSLRVGASYDATCRALHRYKLINPSTRERLLQTRPQSIKDRLLSGYDKPAGWSDVWILSDRDEGTVIEGSKTDLFILKLREHSGAGYLWTFDQLDEANFAIVQDSCISAESDTYGGEVTRFITAQSRKAHSGELALTERQPWLPTTESLSSLRFKYELTGPETEGMSKAERKHLMGVA
jgi:Zn-dependent peptidase ImmA (M78 family)